MSGSDIIEGLKQAARGDLARVTLFENGERQVWVRDTEISRLQSRVEELERALKPFAVAAKRVGDGLPDNYDVLIDDCVGATVSIEMGDLRKARTTLEASDRGGK